MANKTVEKKGNPDAETPALVAMVKDNVTEIEHMLTQFTDAQLLNLGKSKSIKDIRAALKDAVMLGKFMRGDQIKSSDYDTVKKFIKEDYKVTFADVTTYVVDKETHLPVAVITEMATNSIAVEMEEKSENLTPEIGAKYAKFTLTNQSGIEHAQAGRLALQAQVTQAKAIAHKRMADAMAVKLESLHEIWRQTLPLKEGTVYKPLIEEVPEEMQILTTF